MVLNVLVKAAQAEPGDTLIGGRDVNALVLGIPFER